ncbi:MAG: UvrB/UvrC motif-containing protein [Bacillota bacterium]|nr:UvrB/UvrC motif-containing protein [Bacillota bacterium]
MLCQRCGNKEAVMQVTTVHNGMKKVEYICQDCENHMAGSNLSFNMNNPWQMMAKLMEGMGMETGNSQALAGDITCPSCGTTYREFSTRGRFGCGNCYDAFENRLEPLFDNIHFSHEYKGKMPQSPGLLEDEDKLAMLTREKEEAVAREDYERAAELQKQIRELKKKKGSGN